MEENNLDIKDILDLLSSHIGNASQGLPEEIFYFISRVTPIVNVDLLIKNKQKQSLLTWRDDGYHPPSWHIPGGIIRYKERASDRIRAVASTELGAEVMFKKEPLAFNEVIHPLWEVRGHFISLLYECMLTTTPDKSLAYKKGIPKPGEWAWHSQCPDNLIPVHEMYRKFL